MGHPTLHVLFGSLATLVMTNGINVQTERECVTSSLFILEGDSMQLYFEYGSPNTNVDTLQCFRDSEGMVTYIAGGAATFTASFSNRGSSLTFNERGVIITLITNANDKAVFSCWADLISPEDRISSSVDLTNKLHETVTPTEIADAIEHTLPDTITSLPVQVSFFSNTGEGVLECQPADITSVVDKSGTTLCNGVVEGSSGYCNFSIDEVSDTELCLTAHATLFEVNGNKEFCVPVNIATTTEETTTGDETTSAGDITTDSTDASSTPNVPQMLSTSESTVVSTVRSIDDDHDETSQSNPELTSFVTELTSRSMNDDHDETSQPNPELTLDVTELVTESTHYITTESEESTEAYATFDLRYLGFIAIPIGLVVIAMAVAVIRYIRSDYQNTAEIFGQNHPQSGDYIENSTYIASHDGYHNTRILQPNYSHHGHNGFNDQKFGYPNAMPYRSINNISRPMNGRAQYNDSPLGRSMAYTWQPY